MSELGGTREWKHSRVGPMQCFLLSRSQTFAIEKTDKTEWVKLVGSFAGRAAQASESSASTRPVVPLDLVVRAFVEHLDALPNKTCDMQELAMLPAWSRWGRGLGKIKGFLQKQGGSFALKQKKKLERFGFEVQLNLEEDRPVPDARCFACSPTSSTSLADAIRPSPPPTGTSPGLQHDAEDRPVPLASGSKLSQTPSSLLEGPPGVDSSPVCLGNLAGPPPLGSLLWVDPEDLRWTHDSLQRLFTCGRSLAEVADRLQQRTLLPSDLPTVSMVYHGGKWYSRNNRRLWCLKTAGIRSVQVRITAVDQHFLRGLTTRTDGLSVDFFPACICKVCGSEFPNRSGLRAHFCPGVYSTSAIDWDDNASEASSEAHSEEGTYGEDGFWRSVGAWDDWLKDREAWTKDGRGRSPLWRAAAAGNQSLLQRFLSEGALVDDVDSEGVTPLLAAVRRGHWRVAEVLLWAGAFQKPWTWTVRKGKKWSSARAARYDRLLDALRSGQGISDGRLTLLKKKGQTRK